MRARTLSSRSTLWCISTIATVLVSLGSKKTLSLWMERNSTTEDDTYWKQLSTTWTLTKPCRTPLTSWFQAAVQAVWQPTSTPTGREPCWTQRQPSLAFLTAGSSSSTTLPATSSTNQSCVTCKPSRTYRPTPTVSVRLLTKATASSQKTSWRTWRPPCSCWTPSKTHGNLATSPLWRTLRL